MKLINSVQCKLKRNWSVSYLLPLTGRGSFEILRNIFSALSIACYYHAIKTVCKYCGRVYEGYLFLLPNSLLIKLVILYLNLSDISS
jgi:hypothetical protein